MLSGPGVTDEVIKDVGRLKTLIQLVVEAKAMTDAGVKEILCWPTSGNC